MKDESFKDFVLDQLSGLPELRSRPMFGGHGLYASEKFFGIMMHGRLYFKTDEHTRPIYAQRGMEPFIYEKARQTTTLHYYEVPAEVLENKSQAMEWAKRALQSVNERPGKSRQPSARTNSKSVRKKSRR